MKIFFDTNVHVAESLLGAAAQRMIEATQQARWRMHTTSYVVDEVAFVVTDDFEDRTSLISLISAVQGLARGGSAP